MKIFGTKKSIDVIAGELAMPEIRLLKDE